MPITCICPQCHKPLAIGDEFAGQPMRCPLCMALFQSPPATGGMAMPGFAGSPPVPRQETPPPRQVLPPNFDMPGSREAPRRPRSGPAGPELNGVRTSAASLLAPGWHMVIRGLGVIPPSLLIVAVTIFLGRTFLYFVTDRDIYDLALLVSVPVTILGTLAAVLGTVMCCLVPPESGTRKLALAAGGCLVGFMAVTLLTLAVTSLFGPQKPQADALHVLIPPSYIPAAILGLAGTVLFLFFLRGVAIHFQNKRLAQSVLYCALFVAGSPLILLFIIMLLWITSKAIGGKSEGLAIMSALVVYLIGAVDLFWFIRVLADVRRALTRAFLDLAT